MLCTRIIPELCKWFWLGREHGFPSRRPEEYKLWRRTFRHLKRDDVKQSIKEYEQLLLDSHSTRKGATNAGAQGGLLQESCEALGQSVHHTGCWRYLLKRYFKEHNAGVASVQPLKNHLNLNINVSTGLIDDYPVDRRTAQSVSCGILVRARLGPVQ